VAEARLAHRQGLQAREQELYHESKRDPSLTELLLAMIGVLIFTKQILCLAMASSS
jgi:hypothetical protein